MATAHRLKRKWIGIDITYLAIDLIEKRLAAQHGPKVRETYDVRGIPRDVGGARALFKRNPFDFERWAVSLVNGQPNEKQVGDEGTDGIVRFPLDAKGAKAGKVVVSVKGGKSLNPSMVRDLIGTVNTKGEMGVLISLETPTRGMVGGADRAGFYQWPLTGHSYPRIQLVTVAQLLADDRPDMPPAFLPYIKAPAVPEVDGQLALAPEGKD